MDNKLIEKLILKEAGEHTIKYLYENLPPNTNRDSVVSEVQKCCNSIYEKINPPPIGFGVATRDYYKNLPYGT